jgi:plastocyanin
LAGCGGSDSSSTTTSPSSIATVQLAANPSGLLSYNTKSITTAAGRLTIDFANHSELPHNLTTARADGTVLGATPTFRGGTRTLTLDLPPGTYSFYCTVPGHRSAGMQGTLIVK